MTLIKEVKNWIEIFFVTGGLFSAPFILISTITGLYNENPHLFPIVSIVVCTVLLVYFRLSKVGVDSGIVDSTGEPLSSTKYKYKNNVRQIIPWISIPVILGASIWLLKPLLESKGKINPNGDFIIGLADFYDANNSESKEDKIMPRFFSELERRMIAIEDTVIYPKKLRKRIIQDYNSNQKAKELGKNSESKLIVYGWYQETKDSLWAEVGIEIINDSLASIVKGRKTDYQAHAESFQVQLNIARDITHLIHLILGIVYSIDGNLDLAKEVFEKIPDEKSLRISPSLQREIYFYKGYLQHKLGNNKRANYYYQLSIDLGKITTPQYNQALLNIRDGNMSEAMKLVNRIVESDIEQKEYYQKFLGLLKSIKDRSYVDYNREGQKRYDNGDYKEAVENYNMAILLNPLFDSIYFNRGMSLHELGYYQDAIDDYTQALNLNPNFTTAYHTRGFNYLKLGKYYDAIEDCSKSIELFPQYSVAYQTRGLCYKHLKKYEIAINNYSKAIEIEPSEAQFYINRGISHHEIKAYKDAISDFNQALVLNQGNPIIHVLKGHSFLALKNYQEAIENYTTAVQLSPNNADYYFNRGNARYTIKDYYGAIQDYTKSIGINSKKSIYYLSRASSNYDLKAYTSSMIDLDIAIELNPSSASAYNLKGLIEEKSQHYTEAIENYTIAINFNPKNAAFYSNRGSCKIQLQDYTGAIVDYNNAIKINPTDISYGNRGFIKSQMGNYQSAIIDYNKAIEINAYSPATYDQRGYANFKLENYQKAIADYNRSIELAPEEGRYYISRGHAYRKFNQNENACKDFARATELGHRQGLHLVVKYCLP